MNASPLTPEEEHRWRTQLHPNEYPNPNRAWDTLDAARVRAERAEDALIQAPNKSYHYAIFAECMAWRVHDDTTSADSDEDEAGQFYYTLMEARRLRQKNESEGK